MATTLIEQNDAWVLTLPKTAFQKDFLIRLVEIIQLEEIAQRNAMTSEQAWNLSEEIKASWWDANGKGILDKIQALKQGELLTDIKDLPFLALSIELDAPLWTMDKKLIEGASAKGFSNFYQNI